MSKVWFITGTSRGFGRRFAEAALSRGDRVAATARSAAALEPLVTEYGNAVLPLTLDVTDRAAVHTAVAHAHEAFGRLDIVVNNAGYGLFGAVEELSEAQIRDQFETNLFGALWVTQAVLPILRTQRAGHIVQMSSVAGIVALPGLGGYHASKWALEGLSESLAKEVAPFGIHVTLVEPGGFATDWSGDSAVRAAPLPAYDEVRDIAHGRANAAPGDPRSAGEALLRIVDAEHPPLRTFFGTSPAHYVPMVYAERIDTWRDWSEVAELAQG
ncbi:oxidoreductase [Nocardia sp. SSK8]|uniref:oxidoreductase n=1 Tax=Nocardia sp. SSK8 TaxID=3120154 RepID=UPI00300A0A01